MSPGPVPSSHPLHEELAAQIRSSQQPDNPPLEFLDGVEAMQPPPNAKAAAPATAPISSPASDDKQQFCSVSPQPDSHWPSLNPLTAYYTPGNVQTSESPLKMDVDTSSTSTGATRAMSPEYHMDGRASSVSLDDPDVRLAAEALGDLRADFISSPPLTTTTPSRTSEPLLSLLTTSHPLLAKTIEGTTSAYNSSKNFSPRFKSGAEYVEGYLTPIGNTLGSVGRVTGVEGGVRWFLNAGRRRQHGTLSDIEFGNNSAHKRRRLGPETTMKSAAPFPMATQMGSYPDISMQADNKSDGDMFGFSEERRLSMSTVETLPAYDEQKSPDYTEAVEDPQPSDLGHDDAGSGRRIASPAAWQSRLIMSTSGLSVAMSEESLRSLKYCLNWLRWANDHIGNIINALKSTLEQFDYAEASRLEREENNQVSNNQVSANQMSTDDTLNSNDTESSERGELAAKIAALRSDVLQTLRGVVDTVSKYAGGALPDNARILVRRHLTSLPQRFRLASQTDAPQAGTNEKASNKEIRENAQRALVLAREGLDMMAQVSGVLDGTIVSAEEWCERLGKKKRDERAQSTGSNSAVEPAKKRTDDEVDVVMR